MKPKRWAHSLYLLFILLNPSSAQVIVGKGSYGTVLPSGTVGPQTVSGANAVPKVSSSFSKPVQTNDYWSSLIYPFAGDPFSNVLHAHPLSLKARTNGLQMGYTATAVFSNQDYLFPFSPQLTVGVAGLSAPKAVADDYGDWTVTVLWDDGTRTMRATVGHGLPFVYCVISGGPANVTSSSSPTIWYNQQGVAGLTVAGRHYGLFAPDGSVWTGSTTLHSSLNGKSYFSVALLPDNTPATLEVFRQHAYAFVTGSTVSWTYDEASAQLSSVFAYTTELKESLNGNLNQTLTALYRHQWLNTAAVPTAYQYSTVAATMKVLAGNAFTTNLTFEGVLPALPDQGDYQRGELIALVNELTAETLPETGVYGGTYWNGKKIGRFAQLVNIAHQLGASAAREYFLFEIKKRLEEWFTAGGPQSYVYNAVWKTLTGYPSEFGADSQLNDHNFHAGYSIMGAAIIAQFDSAWARPENWGGMVDLLIRDANNYDRSDLRFPFLRTFDPYAGHSWESGHGDFADGNNEESSSEAMNFATAVILWGAATHQKQVRDLGIYLYVTERSAIEQYWFDQDGLVFPPEFAHNAVGIVWGGKGAHSTWFGAQPDYIHGINMLPFTGGSLYLGRHPDYVRANYDEAVTELNGSAPTWNDILWQYLALSDPRAALSAFYAKSDYAPEEGESKAHTLHWLGNLKKLGHLDASVTADLPTYAVFRNGAGERTYVAYNAGSTAAVVHFSDGYSTTVPARSMRSSGPATENLNDPVVILLADKQAGKVPLNIGFVGSRSFDRTGTPLTFRWDYGDGATATTADTVHTFMSPGVHTVVLSVTNQRAFTARDSVTITATGNGTPFTGTPIPVPGTIPAVYFDKGGEGVGYHDNEPANIGLLFRPSEGVDIENSNNGGYDVYWMVAGEWLEYTIQIPSDGFYDFIPSVASVPGFGNYRILIDNVDVSGKKAVLNTGGWQNWRSIATPKVSVKQGTRILRIEINTDTPSEKKNWLFSLRSIQVNASGGVGVLPSAVPPTSFTLAQNFPNPFNPSTIVSYQMPVAGHVNLRVYDVLGREVTTLVNEEKSAGTYSATWNAGYMPSGVYFYRLTAGTLTQTRQMVLMK